MKPAVFEYADPSTLSEALALLAEHGDEAKILAGGQSLVPLLNMRLAMPAVVVDINRLEGLDRLDVSHELTIPALVRQGDVERARELRGGWPLLTEAIGWVGHPQIRNRGTVVGSLAHADPAAELPVVFSAMDGTMEITGLNGRRVVPADEFFVHIMTTAIEPDEILVKVHLPKLAAHTGTAFLEVARRHGDFAVASVAVVLTVNDGICSRASIALGGVAPVPLRVPKAEGFLAGQAPSTGVFSEAGRIASSECEPVSDIHGTAEYRRDLVAALVPRALATAATRAKDQQEEAA